MRVLVTGGCGFIGSNFIRLALSELDGYDHITNLDALTYAGNPANLADFDDDARLRLVKGDIADAALLDGLFSETPESHVDRSIEDPQLFLRVNVLGTQTLLEAARRHKVARFLQVGTDEVYGSLGPVGSFVETTPVNPRSPYSASKAAADHLAMAYCHTFGLDVVVTRCSNNYGPYQFPEKLIPLMILNAHAGRELPVYGDGMQVRDWLHVLDHCRALDAALKRGVSGEVYNIGGGTEMPNIELVKLLLAALGQPESLIRHVTDRPGHDRRYSIDSTKARTELGWTPRVPFETGLRDTVAWYLEQTGWVGEVTSGAYREYYDRHYAGR